MFVKVYRNRVGINVEDIELMTKLMGYKQVNNPSLVVINLSKGKGIHLIELKTKLIGHQQVDDLSLEVVNSRKEISHSG